MKGRSSSGTFFMATNDRNSAPNFSSRMGEKVPAVHPVPQDPAWPVVRIASGICTGALAGLLPSQSLGTRIVFDARNPFAQLLTYPRRMILL